MNIKRKYSSPPISLPPTPPPDFAVVISPTPNQDALKEYKKQRNQSSNNVDSIEDIEIPPMETYKFESAALKEYGKREKQGVDQQTNHLDISSSIVTNQSSMKEQQVKFSFNISYSYME